MSSDPGRTGSYLMPREQIGFDRCRCIHPRNGLPCLHQNSRSRRRRFAQPHIPKNARRTKMAFQPLCSIPLLHTRAEHFSTFSNRGQHRTQCRTAVFHSDLKCGQLWHSLSWRSHPCSQGDDRQPYNVTGFHPSNAFNARYTMQPLGGPRW